MLRSNRPILFRLLTVLLAVLMVAFPAAAAGRGECCAARQADDHAAVDTHDCCHASADADAHDEDVEDSAPADCPQCAKPCCRATADVMRTRAAVAIDQVVVAPVLLPAESVHDAVTCEAIFHPPRA